MILCWSAKGGSGVTVVTAALAVLLSEPAAGPERRVLAIDLAGDLPAVFGVAEPTGPGVVDWLTAQPAPDAAALRTLTIDLGTGVSLLPAGAGRPSAAAAAVVPAAGWSRLAAAVEHHDGVVVVDAGLGPPPAPLLELADASLLVTRACYLSLRRATTVAAAATGVVLVVEPGRALGRHDITTALGVPVVAEVPLDPAVARAVDAGLMAGRIPSSLRHGVRGVA